MWDVLKEYPAARVRLEAIAVKRLEKYKKAPLEKGKRNHIHCFFLLLEIFVFSFLIACCIPTKFFLVEVVIMKGTEKKLSQFCLRNAVDLLRHTTGCFSSH